MPEPADVEAVALGPDGLIAGIRPGAAYFDLSTNSPGVVKMIHAASAEKDAHMLDAPVSGGPAGAASRKLAIWVGGDENIFNRCKAILDAIGDRATYIGPCLCCVSRKAMLRVSGRARNNSMPDATPLRSSRSARGGVGGRLLLIAAISARPPLAEIKRFQFVIYVAGKRGKTRGVIAGLVPAISIRIAQRSIIGMAGTSPAMSKREMPRVLPLLLSLPLSYTVYDR